MPQVLGQLEDELARSHRREAFWISLLAHFVIIVLIATSAHWMPAFDRLHLIPMQDAARQKEPTFLVLPNDAQKLPHKVESDKLSDKDRRAETRRPQLDKKTLEELRSEGNQMAPGPRTPQAQPVPPQQAMQQGQQASPQPAQQQAPRPQSAQNSQQATTAPPQPHENPFKAFSSAGAAIAQAARNAQPRLSGGGGGAGYGQGSMNRGQHHGAMEILNDTEGVDFGPYMSRIHPIVEWNMYRTAPESAMPPLSKHGEVILEFLIMRDGKITGIRIVASSGDRALDRAAFATLTSSSPLPPLPHEFHGPYLQVRGRFIYNARPGDF